MSGERDFRHKSDRLKLLQAALGNAALSAPETFTTGSPVASSAAAIVAGSVVTAVVALAWFPLVAGLASLSGSDAAGNALAKAYTAILLGIVWLLLSVLALVAWWKGDMPRWLAIVLLVLLPVSCVGAFEALELLSDPYRAPYLWPIALPAVVPPLLVMFCFWALVPALHRAISPAVMGVVTLGGIFVLCVALFPMGMTRGSVHEQEAEAQRRYDREFAALRPDAPLPEWTRFLDTRNEVQRARVIEGIRALKRRQSEAEAMLERGDFPLGYLSRFDLDPTQPLCGSARTQLRKQAAALAPARPNAQKYAAIAQEVEDAVSALEWLTGYGCNCEAEVTAWENAANAFAEPGFGVVRLHELHDPKKLGQILRENPERFSMLTPQSHLKAWLKFIDMDEYRARALEGAQRLVNRSRDAEEILSGDEYASYPLMKYLPVLDLETTPKLCSGAGKRIHARFAAIYKPGPEDRVPYREFLDRLGETAPLDDLLWLAAHGCDLDAELNDAETLIAAYQDTPGRAAMLAKLASLHRKR